MSVSRRSFLRGAIVGVGSAVAAAAYADFDAQALTVEAHTLPLQNWKADGLRVGFLTDIHVNDSQATELALHASQQLVELRPDLVIFGGDAVDTSRPIGFDNTRTCLAPLQKLNVPMLAVLGNHDYWSGNPQGVRDALSDSGFRVLRNEVVRFDQYHVAGYDDRIGGIDDPMFQPDLLGTLAVMHEPDDVDVVPQTVSLQLSGHSHGGQICLPFGVAVHTPKGARKYLKGFYPEANVPLYVSRGVGTVGFKWRTFCAPEITLLTLKSAG